MKKVFGLLAVAGLVAACGQSYETVAEYVASENCARVATTPAGDYIVKCAPNAVFDDVLETEVNTTFATDGAPEFYLISISEAALDKESVYVNVVPQASNMRVLVPGATVDVKNPSAPYAVLVEGVVAVEEVPAEAPAEAPAAK